MDNMIEALIVVGILTVLFWVLTTLVEGLWLRKSNIKNWGLIFVPIVGTYKTFHYMFDLMHAGDVDESSEMEYIKNRRKHAWIYTGVLVVISFVFGLMDGLAGDSVSAFGIVFNIIVSFFILFSLFKSVAKVTPEMTNVRDGQFSNTRAVIYTVLSLVTLGFFFVIAFSVFVLKDKYQYVLSDSIDERYF